jgi:hypothetical protein
MDGSTRVWVTPELTVLVRSRPEESVLGGCKTTGLKTTKDNKATGCNEKDRCDRACNAWGTS